MDGLSLGFKAHIWLRAVEKGKGKGRPSFAKCAVCGEETSTYCTLLYVREQVVEKILKLVRNNVYKQNLSHFVSVEREKKRIQP